MDWTDVIIIDCNKLRGSGNYERIKQMKSYTNAILKSPALFNFTQLQQPQATLDKSGHFAGCKWLCLELWVKWLVFVALLLCLTVGYPEVWKIDLQLYCLPVSRGFIRTKEALGYSSHQGYETAQAEKTNLILKLQVGSSQLFISAWREASHSKPLL